MAVQTVTVLLRCVNDGCPDYDVDRPAPGYWRAIYREWESSATEDADGSLDVSDELCPGCGVLGEVI